jgi:hypothetical protein
MEDSTQEEMPQDAPVLEVSMTEELMREESGTALT